MPLAALLSFERQNKMSYYHTDKHYQYKKPPLKDKWVHHSFSIEVHYIRMPWGGKIMTPISRMRMRRFKGLLDRWCEIDSEYSLGLTTQELELIAREVAHIKAYADVSWYQAIGNINPLQALLLVAALVISLIPGGQFIGAYIAQATLIKAVAAVMALVASLTSIAYNVYSNTVETRAQGIAGEAQGTAKAAAMRRRAAQEASNVLTHLLIFGGYEIYANRSIFLQNAPGSQTFSNSLAYDVSKGLRGDIKQDKTDELIQSRTGMDKAGGKAFHNQVIGNLGIPIQDFNINERYFIDSLGDRLTQFIERINKGFALLFDNDFGMSEGAGSAYSRVMKTQTDPIKKQICTLDFLEKNKNYNKNLRLEIPLHMNDFTKPLINKLSEEEENAYLEELYEKGLLRHFDLLPQIVEEGNIYFAFETKNNKKALFEYLENPPLSFKNSLSSKRKKAYKLWWKFTELSKMFKANYSLKEFTFTKQGKEKIFNLSQDGFYANNFFPCIANLYLTNNAKLLPNFENEEDEKNFSEEVLNNQFSLSVFETFLNGFYKYEFKQKYEKPGAKVERETIEKFFNDLKPYFFDTKNFIKYFVKEVNTQDKNEMKEARKQEGFYNLSTVNSKIYILFSANIAPLPFEKGIYINEPKTLYFLKDYKKKIFEKLEIEHFFIKLSDAHFKLLTQDIAKFKPKHTKG